MNTLRRIAGALLVAVVSISFGASAQEYRWVRGTVTAMTDTTLTVYVADPDLNLVFTLDESSMVVAKGPGSWVHPPEQTRPKLSNVVRIGDKAEVHYARKGQTNYAGLVLTAREDTEEAGRSLAGRVWAVSDRTLTVLADGREYTFTLAAAARVIAPGAGGREAPAEKGKPELSRLLARNDIVLVYYRAQGPTLLATEIRVLSGQRQTPAARE